MIERAQLILHNNEIEWQVLSVMMSYSESYFKSADLISEELFENPTNKVLYKVIKAIYDRGDIADMSSVWMELERQHLQDAPDVATLAEISSHAVTSATFGQNIDMLAEMAKRRRYYILGHKLMACGSDATLDLSDLDKEIDAIREQNLRASKDVLNMQEANNALTEGVKANLKDDVQTGIPTGYKFIDDKGGLQYSDFIVIAGDTSQGKTTLAIDIMVNAAVCGVPSMMFSLEMTSKQLAARINAPLCHIPSGILLYKKLRSDQIRDFEHAKSVSNKYPIYIDDISSSSYEKIKESIRANAIKRGIKLFFIDYLQILTTVSRQQNSNEFLELVSRELKNLAKELNVCIVALSQLNRDKLDPRPTLARLKASSGIEQAADMVILVYRPSYYGRSFKNRPDLTPVENYAELIVGKGRNVGTGSQIVGFNGALSLFYDLQNGTSEPPKVPEAEQQALPF